MESQTTTRKLDTFELGSPNLSLVEPLSNWFEEGDILVAIDEDDIEIVDILISDGPNEHWNANLYSSPAAGFEAGDFVIADSSRNLFLEQLSDWLKQGWEVGLVSPSKAERHRFLEILERDESDFTFTEGRLAKGFVAPEQKLVVLSTLEIFGRQHLPGTKGREALAHQRTAAAITGVHELNQGEFVVHADYGIGEFIGLIESDEGDEELGIKYDGGSTLHVPIDQSHLVARYVGIGGGKPRLNKLGDKRWKKARKIAEAAVLDYAAQLLRLQAERESKGGYGHAPDGQWMQEFEASFPFTETPDQRTAIEATKIDMESPRPMDRLICGDV